MDENLMRRCITLAKLGEGKTKLNPMVGCVIERDGKIIAEGYHEYFGGFHAERNALLKEGVDFKGATLYVNLEPCCHFGKTPPCTDIIIKSGIKKVVIGTLDDNEKVSGRGVKILRENGIEVVTGVLESECRDLNRVFFYNQNNNLPYVTYKYAMSLDGKIATKKGDSKWISSISSRKFAHHLRATKMGIMVGIGTVLKDDPTLDVRLSLGENPIRIIVDSKLRIPISSRVFSHKSEMTIIATSNEASEEKERELLKLKNVKILRCGNEEVDLKKLMYELYKIGISSILLEGGGTLSYSMFRENLINEVVSFICPLIIGGSDAKSPVEGVGFSMIDECLKLKPKEIRRIEDDILVRWNLCSQE